MLETFSKRLSFPTLFLLGIIQSIYLSFQFSLFAWIGCDDLLTLTLIRQDSFIDFYKALQSGLNLFPPFYFLIAYLLIDAFEISKDVLLWVHLPLLWLSIFLTYRLFRSFTSRQIASFSTVAISTLKSAFLTQSVYVRPYCFYYCASLATTLSAIFFYTKPSNVNFFIYWLSFQVLSQTHYYGLPIALLVSIPLLWIKLPKLKRLKFFIITLTPTVVSYSYFLPKQIDYLLFTGTTGGTNLKDIVLYYQVLAAPACIAFIILIFVSFISKNQSSCKNVKTPTNLLLLGASPLIIIVFLNITIGEGTYYRYFIPAQVGVVAFTVWVASKVSHFYSLHNSSTMLLFCSLSLILFWSIRNFGESKDKTVKNFPSSMEFDHSIILNEKFPFYTSHIPTFLKLVHDPKWQLQSKLLRTDSCDFTQLPDFNKMLTPSSLEQLENESDFFYHFYYSGPHSNISFNPLKWAKENNYTVTKICDYPQVFRFNRH